MATTGSSTQQTEFFQQLKAICVPLSRLVLRSGDANAEANETLSLVESLTATWTAQVRRDPSIPNEKLAGYVFFPISHLLRKQDHYPVRVIEATIRLLGTLVEHGWKTKITPELSQQLLLFLSFTVGGSPGQTKKRDLPEETIIEGYRAISILVDALGKLPSPSPSPLIDDKVIPALGQSVTVVLDAIGEGIPSLIQLEALKSLQTVFTVIRDTPLLAQFLPGTVSTLAKILSPPSSQRTQRRVLIASLDVLHVVLVNTLGDIKVRGVLAQIKAETQKEQGNVQNELAVSSPEKAIEDNPEDVKYRIDLNPAWLRATASQVKIALSSVLKLRNHESEEVQSALDRLCIRLLDECHSSLADSQTILVETAMMLEDEDATRSTLQTSLQDLVSVYPELGGKTKFALYNWISGLPRAMQSNDERSRQLAVRNILRGTKHAASLQIDSSTLEDSLGDALKDSIIGLIKTSKLSRIQDSSGMDLALLSDSGLSMLGSGSDVFSPVILNLEGQKSTRREITTLLSNVSTATQQIKLASTMLSYVEDYDGVDQVASYWLAFELLKASYRRTADLDDFLDLTSLEENNGQEKIFQELYDFSASVLSSQSDSADVDWRLEAIAMEVTAFAASRLKTEFRPELIDVLYPVATFLGSATPQLRSHAIATLNILASSCGYNNVSELIVDNADYMVNSVSSRLNKFEISPASTKVLTMLIHLTGPKLIPYLDDVVAAIFAALDNYHGYPVFVESLFSVLSEIVTQGVKSNMLLLEDANPTPINHRKRSPAPIGIDDILSTLKTRADRAQKTLAEENEPLQGHPTAPWGPKKGEKNKAKSLLDRLENPTDSDEEEPSAEVERPKPGATPTYNLLTRVLSLTQHYLTSPTPTLRKSLLDLVATVAPALAPDEDAFLPLVNAVWPVVITRLHDPEPFVAIAACKALEALCVAAGDFLSTRFQTEWGEGLAKWLKKVKDEASRTSGTGGKSTATQGEGILVPGGRGISAGLGRFAQTVRVWEAAVEMVGAVLRYVRVDDAMFDEILELVVDDVPRNRAIRDALEVVNADAMWLALYERGRVEGRREPVMEGVRFATMAMG
ncbi:hypothetical protein OQA88_470 [Cercophora sp. LCS_1]